MPNYPQPASKWLAGSLSQTALTAQTAAIVKQPLLSNITSSAEGVGSFVPTAADTWQQPSGVGPTVQATIGASGQALIIASALIYVPGAPALGKIAFSYTWTPAGSQAPQTVGPNGIGGASPVTEIARFGYTGGSGAAAMYSTVGGVQTFSGLPKNAFVTFGLWFQSGGEVGTQFQEVDLTVLPM